MVYKQWQNVGFYHLNKLEEILLFQDVCMYKVLINVLYFNNFSIILIWHHIFKFPRHLALHKFTIYSPFCRLFIEVWECSFLGPVTILPLGSPEVRLLHLASGQASVRMTGRLYCWVSGLQRFVRASGDGICVGELIECTSLPLTTFNYNKQQQYANYDAEL